MTSMHFSAAAVSFDLSDWSQIDVSGTGARAFLHSFCTNDINRLATGDCCEAFFCDVKGRIHAHTQVLAGEDFFRLLGVRGTADVLVPHLRKYLLDAPVEITDRSEELGLLCLHGNGIQEILQTVSGQQISLEPQRGLTMETPAGPLLVATVDLLSHHTQLVSGDRFAVESLREQIPAQFLELGDRDLFELLRIEAGYPHYGRDLTAQEIAQSAARTRQTISFTKGCYLGQEPIARLDAMGHTTKELRGLRIAGTGIQGGDTVIAEGKEVGRVTTVSPSADAAETLTLAMLRVQHAAPGTEVIIQTATGERSAQVFWREDPT